MKNNFIIDTNTLISAFLFSNSKTKLAFDKARRIGELQASIETYKEICEVLVRPKFDKYVSLEIRLAVINEFKEFLVFSEITETITECRDPKDNKFLELAVAVGCSLHYHW